MDLTILSLSPSRLVFIEATQLDDALWQVHQKGRLLLSFVPATSQEMKQQ